MGELWRKRGGAQKRRLSSWWGRGQRWQEAPCLVALIFLNSLGEISCWEGEDREGFQANGKILKQLLSGRNRNGWKKRREMGHQGPSWASDCVREPVDAKHRHASQVLHKDEALCPCSSPDTLLGMRRLCRSVYLILIKFDGLWGFSLLGLTRRIPTATPSQTPVTSCRNFPTHTVLQINHPQMSILPYPK